MIGYNDIYSNTEEERYDSTLNITDGGYVKVGNELRVKIGSAVNVKNATLDVNKVINAGNITVDADSIFSAGSIVNTGMFNSDKAGEMIVLGAMTVDGNINTDTLVLNQGAALSVDSLTVSNLTLSIGSTLAITGTAASNVESITVVGDIVPKQSEFTLITSGWDKLNATSITYKGQTYTVSEYSEKLSGINFITVGSSLYVKDFGANISGIYVGELVEGLNDGEKFTDKTTGATYIVGKDAFASLDDASDALKEDGAKDKVTSVIIDSDTKLSTIASNFKNIKEVDWTIGADDGDITDRAGFEDALNLNLNLKNDGHLDATISITGDFTFTNTSVNTLVGSYTAYTINGINTGAMSGTYVAEDKIVIDNTNGIIGEANSEIVSPYFFGSQVEITGGSAYNVSVDAASLTLTDTEIFELNTDSSVLNGADNIWIPADLEGVHGTIFVVGNANLSIKGDKEEVIGANIQSVDHTGTVTFNGKQTYTGNLSAYKFVVAANSNVTVNSNQFDFNELEITGTLSTDFTSQDSYTTAGSITGTGSFITTHGGTWIINDSVERNFSGFTTGTVKMDNANASIVMGKGDAVAESTIDSSYFADGTTVTIDGDKSQSVVLAGNEKITAINFAGNGTINVGDYTDGAFAVKSSGFAQTLSGVNSDFTGTVNVSEGATLNLDSVIGAKNINLDAPSTDATGAADATKLVLSVEDAAVKAKLSGDSNDIIDVNKNQKLDTAEALNAFHGTVELKDNTLTLNAANDTEAKFTSTASGVINANADQIFSGDNSGFTGDIKVAEGKSLTLENAMGAKSINLDKDDDTTAVTSLNLNAADLTLNAVITGDANDEINVQQSATLEKDGALNKFNGDVNVNANTITLNGSNTTDAKFTSNDNAGVIDANADQTLTGTGALNNFHGEVALEGNTLNLNGANDTDAKFTSNANAGVINANADQTFRGDNSGFTGDVNVAEGKTLTLENAMGAKSINLDKDGNTSATGDVDATKLKLNKENIVIASNITGDENDQINVQQSATLTGDNSNFKGDVTITEGMTLKLQGNLGADSIVLGPTEDPNPTTLVLEKDGLALNAVITGDTDDVIDVAKNASLETDAALNNFYGDVNVNANTITLNGSNNTAAEFTSTASGVINANADQTFNGDNSGFKGTLNIDEGKTVSINAAIGASNINLVNKDDVTASTTLNLNIGNGDYTLGAKLTGDSDDLINVQQSITFSADNKDFKGTVNLYDQMDLTIQSNLGADTVNFGVSSDLNITSSDLNATRSAVIDSKFVSATNGTDTTATVTISAGISATLSQMGALDNFNGTVKTGNASSNLILNGANETSATITGTGNIVANADQIFSGNVSGFSGIYDIGSNTVDNNSITLSGTIADKITAKGDTLILSNTTGKDIVINSTADGNLTNLNFGANNVKLTGGDTDDFTNITGSGDILDFGVDQTFGKIDLDIDDDAATKAGTIFINSADEITADSVDANINITVDSYQDITSNADITFGGSFDEEITVNVDYKKTYLQGGYKLATSEDFNTEDYIILNVTNFDDEADGEKAENHLYVDKRVVIKGKTYLLQLKDNTLILKELPGYSNYVAIDGDWTGRVPTQSVNDEGKERYIGYDAASTLDDAVGYIRGFNTGVNPNAGTNMGDATMELMDGAYKLNSGTLMTNDNGVTQLVLKGRDGNTVIISGTLTGSDGSNETSLRIENVRTTGYVFGGGDLTIDNSSSVRSSGNVIAAGIANKTAGPVETMIFDTALTINGGYYSTSVLTGGSVAYGENAEVVVNGDTAVIINNTHTDDTLTITGNIFGGSYAAQGNVTQTGDAYVFINAVNETTLRGNIYVSGFQSGKADAKLTMTGNSYITFRGNADNLNFTGTVSAIQSAKEEIITFKNFNGAFNGSISGFDTVVISGDSSLALGRRQTETAGTTLAFTINSETKANSTTAMYTVRDSNAWEFSKNIVIDTTGSGAKAGDKYLIVDNYAGGFDGFSFTVNGNTFTVNSINDLNTNGLTYSEGKLVYTLTSDANKVDLDVDAVLSGSFNSSNLNITGISDLRNDTFGVKAIAGDIVDSVLTSATIEDVSNTNGIYQLTGVDTDSISTDDVWAGLGVDASGDTIVVWGGTQNFVQGVLDRLETQNLDLNLGDTYTVSHEVAVDSLFKEEYKKNGSNGTLA